jgi:hypothetical protein
VQPTTGLRKPYETPRRTLARYSQAIEAQFSLMGSPMAQLNSYSVVTSLARAVREDRHDQRTRAARARQNFALRLCREYATKYRVDVPPART